MSNRWFNFDMSRWRQAPAADSPRVEERVEQSSSLYRKEVKDDKKTKPSSGYSARTKFYVFLFLLLLVAVYIIYHHFCNGDEDYDIDF